MHLTVGYLAVDVVLVVRQEMPDGHPGRAEYQQLLVDRGVNANPTSSAR